MGIAINYKKEIVKRSNFIEEAAKKELQRLNQLSLLRKLKGAWKDEDHPDMLGKQSTYKWVRKLRREDEKTLRGKLACLSARHRWQRCLR